MMNIARAREIPPTPASLAELAATLMRDEGRRFRNKSDGQPFFYKFIDHVINVGNVDNWSAIIFVSPVLRPMLNVATRLHIDATFKVVPHNLGYQLLTINFLQDGHMFPAVYALCTRGTRLSYEGIFTDLVANVCPDSVRTVEVVMTDYELGLMNAVKHPGAWPRARVVGCFFHFAQSVYRHHMRLHLKQTTDQIPAARKALKMSMALPLLPAYYVAQGVQAIDNFLEQNGLGEVFRRFTLYLRDYWLLTVTPDRMSVYREEHRTNNFLEGFHSQLKARMGVHGNVWPFIEKLHEFDDGKSLDARRLALNVVIAPARRRRWIDHDARLVQAWDTLDNGHITVEDFLSRVSHHVEGLEQRLRGIRLDILGNEVGDDEHREHPALLDLPALPQEPPALPLLPDPPALQLVEAPPALQLVEAPPVMPLLVVDHQPQILLHQQPAVIYYIDQMALPGFVVEQQGQL